MGCEEINGILSEDDCKKVLLNFDENKKLKNFEINKYSEKVVGFLAEHYLLTIFCSDKNGDENCQTFFLKSLPLFNQNQKDYIKNMNVFSKEILMYKNLISEFLKLTSKPFAPKYYFSKSDHCMVLEDISAKNYQVCSEEYLDCGKVKGALDTLAKFHAASIIFEEKRGTEEQPFRINEHFIPEVTEGTFSFTEGHKRNMWCKSATNCLVDLSKFFTDNCKVGDKIRNYVFSDDGLRQWLKPSKRYRNVICHDDLWRNNMMFNQSDDCLLLDFQLTRYSPPVFDVLLLLFINLEQSNLRANFNLWLELYYDYLKTELSLNNIDIEEILPKVTFSESVEDYTLPAWIEACLYGTNVYLPQEVSKTVIANMDTFEEFSFRNRSPFIVKEFESNGMFRKRFSTVLKPLFNIFEKM